MARVLSVLCLFILLVPCAFADLPLTPGASFGYSGAIAVAFGDFDGDGLLDALIHGANAYPIIYRNLGNGSFAEHATLWDGPTGAAHGEQWADVNHDGRPDLIMAAFYGGQMLYINNGDGTFSGHPEFITDSPVDAAIGDYNGDGNIDVIVASNTGVNHLFTGHGDGTFTMSAPFGSRAKAVAWGDFDNDGDLDLAMAGSSDSVTFLPNKLFVNNGDGTFTERQPFSIGRNARCMAWADYDGDGDLDLAIGNQNPYGNANPQNELWRNNGNGTFTRVDAFGLDSVEMAWADYNGDGRPDLVVSAFPGARLYTNNGDGTFSESVVTTTWHGPAVAWADVDNDHDPDLMVADQLYINQAAHNRAPVADAGPDQDVNAGADCTATVSLNGTASSDPDGDPLTYDWSGSFGSASGPTPAVILGIGTHTITLTVTDPSGAQSTDTVVVTVRDLTAPGIASLTATPAVLWPPNLKMVPVAIAASATDNCGSATCQITGIAVNEPASGDWTITGPLSLTLRAKRAGPNGNRMYTITVSCTDTNGNTATRSVSVTVPRNP